MVRQVSNRLNVSGALPNGELGYHAAGHRPLLGGHSLFASMQQPVLTTVTTESDGQSPLSCLVNIFLKDGVQHSSQQLNKHTLKQDSPLGDWLSGA